MIEVWELVILRPLWLLGLPVAASLAGFSALRANGLLQWTTVIDPALMPALRQLGHVVEAGRGLRPWIMGLVAAFLVIGLAGPATRNQNAPVFRNLDVAMILFDLSPSLIRGGGLDDAQAAVSRLIDHHGTRPVALAVYSGESFLVSVPTEEPESLQTIVAVVDGTTMPVAGSRPDRALELARQTLGDAAAERADVILVTDGGGLGPDALDQARHLAVFGARVSGVFVAQDTPPYGVPPANRDALKALTDRGGGIVVDATNVEALVEMLEARRDFTATDKARQAVLFTDHGRWVLMLAMLTMIPLFRKRQTS